MKTLKILTLLLLSITITNSSCATKGTGKLPDDAEVENIVNDFNNLAEKEGVKFKKTYTVEFETIKRKDRAVGLCYMAPNFRKIKLDVVYWGTNDALQRKFLLFHELTHCLCSRGHTYGDDKSYEIKSEVDNFVNFIARLTSQITYNRVKLSAVEGYFDDGCPLSIMHPYTLQNYCIRAHEEHYKKEMFNNCNPW